MALIVDYTCPRCGVEHPQPPAECPHLGRERMPSAKVTREDRRRTEILDRRVRDLGDQREDEKAREDAAWEAARRERAEALRRAQSQRVRADARAETQAQFQRDLEAFHALRAGQQVAERYDHRTHD